MSDTYHDAAIGWYVVAIGAAERARECVREGMRRGSVQARDMAAAYAADRELTLRIHDLVDEWTSARFARIVRRRIAQCLREHR